MITLTYAVISFYFFGQVAQLSGFSGIGGVQDYTPALVGNRSRSPNRLYYIALVTALVVYFVIRYIVGTPFGVAFQGVRDEPVRMGSLGYDVALHRTLAFAFAAFVASLAGVLYGLVERIVAPDNVGLAATVDLLDHCRHRRPRSHRGGVARGLRVHRHQQLRPRRVPRCRYWAAAFNTVIGLIFLAIVIVSPERADGSVGPLIRKRSSVRRGGASPSTGRGAAGYTRGWLGDERGCALSTRPCKRFRVVSVVQAAVR